MAGDQERVLEHLKEAYQSRNFKSFSAHQRATRVMPGGGSRYTIFVKPFPLSVTGGHGQYVTDIDGHDYLDLAGDYASGLFGKSNPIIRDAIIAALDGGIQLGWHSEKEAEFANLLQQRIPSMELIRFANSGTEAGILSICAAIHHTQRKKVVMFRNGYHGGVISGFDPPPDGPAVLALPFDYVLCPYNDLSETQSIVRDIGHEVACIIVEPMQGAGGCIVGSRDFLHGLRDLATEIGAVLIFDEVQTARLAFHGLQGVHGITPDLTTLGKFFGGGMAFGALGGSKTIMSMFDPRNAAGVLVGGTFNNSVMTMSAGIAALTHVMTEPAIDKLNKLGDLLRWLLNNLFNETGAPYTVSGFGSINQIHCLCKGTAGIEAMQVLYFGLLTKGIAIAQRGLVALTTVVEESDIYHIRSAVADVLKGDLFVTA